MQRKPSKVSLKIFQDSINVIPTKPSKKGAISRVDLFNLSSQKPEVLASWLTNKYVSANKSPLRPKVKSKKESQLLWRWQWQNISCPCAESRLLRDHIWMGCFSCCRDHKIQLALPIIQSVYPCT